MMASANRDKRLAGVTESPHRMFLRLVGAVSSLLRVTRKERALEIGAKLTERIQSTMGVLV